MLITSVNSFNWQADNFNSKLFDTVGGLGTEITTGAANTKGSAVEILSDTVVTENCYGIYVTMLGGRAAGSQRTFLTDILIDTSGGTSYEVLIPNLLSQQNPGGTGCGYYFPLYIPAGSSIAARGQCNAATITYKVGIQVFGKPSRQELVRVGSKVEAIGVDTSTSTGTSVTPGSDAWGSWGSLGTSGQDNWWWQAGACSADSTMQTLGVGLQVSGGDATNKKILVPTIVMQTFSTEEIFKNPIGVQLPVCQLASGNTIYGRLYSQSFVDQLYTMAAYGVK